MKWQENWGGESIERKLAFCILLLLSCITPTGNSGDTISYPGNGQIRTDPFGDNSLHPDAPSNNTVSVTQGLTVPVYGGIDYNDTDDATLSSSNNTVTITNANGITEIMGGLGVSDLSGKTANSGQVTANGNTVTIKESVLDAAFVSGGYAYSRADSPYHKSGQTEASNNAVVFEASETTNRIYGGYSLSSANDSELAVSDYNTVKVRNSKTSFVTGGYSQSVGGNGVLTNPLSGPARSNHNQVIIEGSIATTSVMGGYSATASSAPNLNLSATASDNSVIVVNSTLQAGVYGGYTSSFNGESIVNNNTVIIGNSNVVGEVVGGLGYSAPAGGPLRSNDNSVTLMAGTTIGKGVYGGSYGNYYNPPHPAAYDMFTGNTLNIRGFQGTVTEVQNFQFYDFVLPGGFQASNTLMTISGSTSVDLSSATGSTGTLLSSSVTRLDAAGGSSFQPGDQIYLISKVTNAPTDLTGNSNKIQGQGGVSFYYDWELSVDGSDRLVASLANRRVNPETKSLSEGHAASMAFIRQGHDLIVDTGFTAADAYLGRTGAGWSRPAAFGAVGGGHFRHKTGSHVDVDGVSMMAGLAWRNNGPCGSLLLGAFFEAGYSDYDTHNAFASGAMRGDGDSRYFGGGVLARYDWQSGLYAEVSGRVGGVKNKFHSELTDAFGNRAKYDINSPYFGAHAGIGYKWQLNENALLDVSTKYLWSRQNGDTANVLGDRVRFEDEDSHRVRTGARFSYAVNGCVSPYVGAAFEYEFDGKAHAGAHGASYGVPSLKGGTGIGEIGVTMRRNAFSADLGVQGHVGRREGVTGSLRVGWSF